MKTMNKHDFSDRMQAQSAGNVLTPLTSRDGVPRVRSGSLKSAGTGFKEGSQVIGSSR